MFSSQHTIAAVDPELWAAIQQENERQQEHIELIASENYARRQSWQRRARN
jgi:glycine hydroxymethyltransferase